MERDKIEASARSLISLLSDTQLHNFFLDMFEAARSGEKWLNQSDPFKRNLEAMASRVSRSI